MPRATKEVTLRAKGTPNVDRRKKSRQPAKRKLDAIPDTPDFRDAMYVPALVEVPGVLPLDRYLAFDVPILDQGKEGACVGYGLATVANYLLRQKAIGRAKERVSPEMLFNMARRYDEWRGENYDYSSARGAIKGWHKHGVCSESLWVKGKTPAMTQALAEDAASRPLGAYFRVNHKDLVSMHTALNEVGVIFASATVHSGWDSVGSNGLIKPADDGTEGHAFAIVGYDREGFWIQNSWGKSWGDGGFGRVAYGDWLANGTDAWVVRLGAPVDVRLTIRSAVSRSAAAQTQAVDFLQLRPYVISIGNDGQLKATGQFGTSEQDVETIINDDFAKTTATWERRRLLLYAHGGLISEDGAIDKVRALHQQFLDHEIYPIFFAWHSDYLSTLEDILRDALQHRQPTEAAGGVRDFLLDRLDDLLEPLARALTGKAEWDEMKENALDATTTATGGARITAQILQKFAAKNPNVEVHLAGHSAGAIFLAPLAQLLASDGGRLSKAQPAIGTITLLAPACTMKLFESAYLPVIRANAVGNFSVFTLDDRHEQDDDCAGIYHKSLLYLVSDAFEDQPRIPVIHPDGEPLLGMEHFIRKAISADPTLATVFSANNWVLAPNNEPTGSPKASKAMKHGGFGEDANTVSAMIARITGTQAAAGAGAMRPTSDALEARRRLVRRFSLA